MIKKGLVYGGIMLGLAGGFNAANASGFKHSASTTQNTDRYNETLADKCGSEFSSEIKENCYDAANGSSNVKFKMQDLRKLKIPLTLGYIFAAEHIWKHLDDEQKIDFVIGSFQAATYLWGNTSESLASDTSISIDPNYYKLNEKKELDSILTGFSSDDCDNGRYTK